jgi:hypothetical protein
MDIANLFSIVPTLLVLTACALLWLHHKTVWTVLMFAGEGVSLALHVLLILPGLVGHLPFNDPLFRIVWPCAAIVFAVGLLGHALTQYEGSQRGTTP